MTTPSVAATCFLWGVLFGAGLGIYYGFLRPLGRSHRHLADVLFVAALFPAWVQFSFGICDGDLQLGYLTGFPIGGWLADLTLGRLLRPLWEWFWSKVRLVSHYIKKFFKKTRRFLKKVFAYEKKIEYNKSNKSKTHRRTQKWQSNRG